jgi:hypothetical protein
VTLEEATAKATQLNIMFMETSAKAGHNVKSLFKKIAMSLPGMEKEGEKDAQNASKSSNACLSEFHVTDAILQKSTSQHNQQAKSQRLLLAIADVFLQQTSYMQCTFQLVACFSRPRIFNWIYISSALVVFV